MPGGRPEIGDAGGVFFKVITYKIGGTKFCLSECIFIESSSWWLSAKRLLRTWRKVFSATCREDKTNPMVPQNQGDIPDSRTGAVPETLPCSQAAQALDGDSRGAVRERAAT